MLAAGGGSRSVRYQSTVPDTGCSVQQPAFEERAVVNPIRWFRSEGTQALFGGRTLGMATEVQIIFSCTLRLVELPAPEAEERELLLAWLQALRDSVLRKAEGLDEDQARWRPEGARPGG